jgi:hypothetical protein
MISCVVVLPVINAILTEKTMMMTTMTNETHKKQTCVNIKRDRYACVRKFIRKKRQYCCGFIYFICCCFYRREERNTVGNNFLCSISYDRSMNRRTYKRGNYRAYELKETGIAPVINKHIERTREKERKINNEHIINEIVGWTFVPKVYLSL